VALEARADARRKGRAWILSSRKETERDIFFTTHTHTLCQTPSSQIF
jgi:hypothetical protein